MDINKSEMTKEAIFIRENHNTYFIIKRIFDITFSILLLVLLSPIFLIVSVLIKFDGSKGKIFFLQKRVGENGRIFEIYKFRSMFPDAEKRLEEIQHLNEIEGNMFKIKKDPRVTNIGRFIRAYSIDELPQIFNVLKGDMSLIGPRPPLVKEYENYSEYDKKRLSIKPGITGLWQVSGRNSLSFDEMVALDLKYIREFSFLNDLRITFKTIIVILKKENAY